MPFYEYFCPKCGCTFSLMKSVKEYRKGAICPYCQADAKRSISTFSHNTKFAPGHIETRVDKMKERMWNTQRWQEDLKKKDPDPMRRWREERCKTLKVGPERWQQWATEVKAEETKKKTYDEAWTRREM